MFMIYIAKCIFSKVSALYVNMFWSYSPMEYQQQRYWENKSQELIKMIATYEEKEVQSSNLHHRGHHEKG